MTPEAIPVRLSHLLTQCSVGSIVRGQRFLMVVQDFSKWYPRGQVPTSRQIHYVDQVRSALGIEQKLCRPPVASVDTNNKVTGFWIPAVRFPRWMLCRRCGKLHRTPWKEEGWDDRGTLTCHAGKGDSKKGCGGRLEQVPWVMVHEDGYLADVPWWRIATSQYKCTCPEGPNLTVTKRGNLGQRIVSCRNSKCNASGPLTLYRKGYPRGTSEQPWIRQEPAEHPAGEALIVQVGDVRVHGSVVSRALVIPPESRIRKGTIVDRLYCSSDSRHSIDAARNKLQRKSILRKLAGKWHCTLKDIQAALNEIQRGYPLYGKKVDSDDPLQSEYRALITEVPDFREDEDFVTVHRTAAWKSHGERRPEGLQRTVRLVSRLIEVRRLQEIAVLRGFTRAGGSTVVPPDLRGESPWLPALALRGEGVFFTIEESLIRQWEAQPILKQRAGTLAIRLEDHLLRLDHELQVSPRFLLLHTLAHGLIREFEAQAGYSAAAIRERIYCSTENGGMAGILIYVAVPDKLGSLGGLAELARPERFLRILRAALDALRWCSLDPVCMRHRGHGPGLLNLAACHACTLVPETSCAYSNCLLDRMFVNGDPALAVRSILDFAPRRA